MAQAIPVPLPRLDLAALRVGVDGHTDPHLDGVMHSCSGYLFRKDLLVDFIRKWSRRPS